MYKSLICLREIFKVVGHGLLLCLQNRFMNRFLSFVFLCAAACSMAVQCSAQQAGDFAAGLRATPDGGGATAKYFFDPNFALEGQLNGGGVFYGSSVAAVGLLEYHLALPAPGWRVFFGGGFHIGVWDRNDNGGNEGIFGLDGIGGAEYLFSNIPLGLSADFKPAINFVSHVDFFPHNIFGVAGRFYFSRLKQAPAQHGHKF